MANIVEVQLNDQSLGNSTLDEMELLLSYAPRAPSTSHFL